MAGSPGDPRNQILRKGPVELDPDRMAIDPGDLTGKALVPHHQLHLGFRTNIAVDTGGPHTFRRSVTQGHAVFAAFGDQNSAGIRRFSSGPVLHGARLAGKG